MLNHLQASTSPFPQAETIGNVLTQMVSQSQLPMPVQLSASCVAPINSSNRRTWLPTLETSSFCPKMLFHNQVSPRHSSKCKEVAIAEVSLAKSMAKMVPLLKVKFSKIETSVSLLSTKYNSLLTNMAIINKHLTEVRTLNKRWLVLRKVARLCYLLRPIN